KAKYSKAGKGSITIKGFSAGKPYEQKLEINLPERESANLSLASLWARAKVDDLMDRDLMGVPRRNAGRSQQRAHIWRRHRDTTPTIRKTSRFPSAESHSLYAGTWIGNETF